MWNPEEEKRLCERYGEVFAKDGPAAAVRSVATLAVELAQARGGTMTAERLRLLLQSIPSDCMVEVDEIAQHITSQGATAATLQANVRYAEGEVTGLRAAFDQEQGIARRALNDRDTLRAEVERLKEKETYLANLAADWQRKLSLAESRLAAIRGKVSHQLTMVRNALAAEKASKRPSSTRVAEWSLVEITLEPLAKELDGTAPQWVNEAPAGIDLCVCYRPGGTGICKATNHPCSPRCTHPDAATPGHPERVRERGEAVIAELNIAAERSEDWRLGYADGMEAMRAACLEAVTNYMRSGFGGMPPVLKAAIEGAAT